MGKSSKKNGSEIVLSPKEIEKILDSVRSFQSAFLAIKSPLMDIAAISQKLLLVTIPPINTYFEKMLFPFKEIVLPFKAASHLFENLHKFNTSASIFFENLSETLFRPFKIISELFKKNAEIIRNVVETMNSLNKFTLNVDLLVPYIGFTRPNTQATLPTINETPQEAGSVKKWVQENEKRSFSPHIGVLEWKLTIDGEKSGDVKIISSREEITDPEKYKLLMSQFVGNKPQLATGTAELAKKSEAMVSRIEKLSLEVREIDNDTFVLFIEGYGSSKPIKKCSWVKLLKHFADFVTLPPETILKVWNNYEKNSFKSKKAYRKDKSYVPTIIRQIYEGIEKYFEPAASIIEIRRNKIEPFKGSYSLLLAPTPTS